MTNGYLLHDSCILFFNCICIEFFFIRIDILKTIPLVKFSLLYNIYIIHTVKCILNVTICFWQNRFV